MADSRYRPPEQGKLGQLVDTLVIIALIYVALYAPIVLGLTGAGTVDLGLPADSWESLGQNVTMAAQWEALGHTPETAAELINTRFDYTFSWPALLGTGLLIVGYFAFVLRMSAREYREVIAEKFDDPERR